MATAASSLMSLQRTPLKAFYQQQENEPKYKQLLEIAWSLIVFLFLGASRFYKQCIQGFRFDFFLLSR